MKTCSYSTEAILDVFAYDRHYCSRDLTTSSPSPTVPVVPKKKASAATWIPTIVFVVFGLGSIPIPARAQGATMSTEQVSISSTGQGGNELSRDAAISADGRFVAFVSGATNLVPGTDPSAGLYVRDRVLRTTERIPLPAGVSDVFGPPSISGDGRFVVFAANGPEPDVTIIITHVYLRDRIAGTTERISVTPPNFLASVLPQISTDGHAIAYLSLTATPSDVEGEFNVLVYDRETRQTVVANTTSAGQVLSAPFDPTLAVAISGDGRVVAFPSRPALVPGAPGGQVFVHDLTTRETTIASMSASGSPSVGGHSLRPALSDDGRFVAFYSSQALVPDDTNGMPDTYVRDRLLQTTERVSVDDAGNEVPKGSNLADAPAISADGRFVAFASIDAGLTPADTNSDFDVFVRDRHAGTTERVSVATDGTEANSSSFGPALTANGQTVAFTSYASNLGATKDPAALLDVYVHQTLTGAPPVLSAIVPSTTELWPPNGKVRDVQLAYSVTGGTGQIRCDVMVTDNEPALTRGGATTLDWNVVDTHTVRLRATRLASGSGRVYAITVHCLDEAGLGVSGTAHVTVPHDRRASH